MDRARRPTRSSIAAAARVASWLALASCGHHEQGPTGPGSCAGVVQVDGAPAGAVTILPGSVVHLAVTPPMGASGAPTWSATDGTLGTQTDNADGSSAVDLTLPMTEGNLVVRADWANGCTAALAVTVSTDIAMDAGDENEAGEAGDAPGDDAGEAGEAGMDAPVARDVATDTPVAMDVGTDTPIARDVGADVPVVADVVVDAGALDAGIDAAD